MFSFAVPSQLMPSTSQAFHVGMARVAARISLITSAFSSSLRTPVDVPPVFVVTGGNGGSVDIVTLLPLFGRSRLNEPEALSNIHCDRIQS